MAPSKIIIDTDPGVDDILALLLAFSSSPSELEILLVSITYGNIDVHNCLRNLISLFHHVEAETAWRQSQGVAGGFETLKAKKPLVALGPKGPLADQMMMADYFHGKDGLGGIHESHPHLTPAETWKDLFAKASDSTQPEQAAIADELRKTEASFTPSHEPSHREILRLLRENEPDTITIVAIGPLTNMALAAAEDPDAFLRVKEVVVMGATIDEPGNITPVGEFNTFADSVAAARVLALTSPLPHTTMPPTSPSVPGHPTPPALSPYPLNLSRQLNLTLFPLDITNKHTITRGAFRSAVEPLLTAGSPLAEWTHAFMMATFNKVEGLQPLSGDAVSLQLHDPLCIWYVMAPSLTGWNVTRDEDVRVETAGQWTRGMCVVDRRSRRRRTDGRDEEIAGDTGNWLGARSGNRVGRCVQSPGETMLGQVLLQRVLGV